MDADDILVWSKEYFLSWNDFKAEPNSGAFADSFSSIQYHHSWKLSSEMVDNRVFYEISNIDLLTQFMRHLSWIRRQNATSVLLNHEQGHFDLAELFKNKTILELNKKFNGTKFLTRGQNDEQRKQYAKESSGSMILQELEKYSNKLLQLREKYDQETNYGSNVEKQTKYDKKFFELRR